ncbi:transposase [Nocardia sp. NBC_01377]|uniref:transposase n=1 Tax=Nocardia sp. NBC_01377 TaxID=2903595 RepID=UPI003246A710
MKPLGDDSSCDRTNFDPRASLNIVHDTGASGVLGDLSGFREEFYRCLTSRSDALFELADAVLCADGPVRSLPELSLVGEHRRGHGSVYAALDRGRVEVDRLRRALAVVPLPRAAGGRLVLAVDITSWLRPEAHTCPQRMWCHTYGRARNSHLLVAGWPYSVVCALETGHSSWTAPLDAARLAPGDDAVTVTAEQLRTVIANLVAAKDLYHVEGHMQRWLRLDRIP